MDKTRIRYKKTNKDNILKSVKDLHSQSTGAMYRVKIDTEECNYIITNINSERTYKGGEGINNLHVLKRKIKQHLKRLGVQFDKEVRDNSSRIPGKNCSYKAEDLENMENENALG